MKKLCLALLLVFEITICTKAQNDKTAYNAFLITRMVNKFHVQPKETNDELAAHIFKQMLLEMDKEKKEEDANEYNTLNAAKQGDEDVKED